MGAPCGSPRFDGPVVDESPGWSSGRASVTAGSFTPARVSMASIQCSAVSPSVASATFSFASSRLPHPRGGGAGASGTCCGMSLTGLTSSASNPSASARDLAARELLPARPCGLQVAGGFPRLQTGIARDNRRYDWRSHVHRWNSASGHSDRPVNHLRLLGA